MCLAVVRREAGPSSAIVIGATYSQILIVALFTFIFLIAAATSFASQYKITAPDASWPSEADWIALNNSISGSLIRTVPVAPSCWAGNLFGSNINCATVQKVCRLLWRSKAVIDSNRSSGAKSLSIWTHSLRTIRLADNLGRRTNSAASTQSSEGIAETQYNSAGIGFSGPVLYPQLLRSLAPEKHRSTQGRV